MHIHQHPKNYKVTVLLVCMNVRAGAILEKFAEIKANLNIAVGVQPEVPCQISAQYFSSIFSAGPLKFQPHSTGGRKSEVGILG